MKKIGIVISVIAIFVLLALALPTVIAKFTLVPSNDPIVKQIRANFARLNPEYGKIPIQEGDSSYTENKSVITLCLKDPDTGKPYGINTMMYVALHELAHVLSATQDHTPEFKNKFGILLKRAQDLGMYDPNVPMPSTYCNVKT